MVDKSETVRLNVSKGTGLVDVPSLVGQTDAEAQLSRLGLEANVVEVPSVQPAGVVVAQHPTGGQVKKGSTVRLNISSGSP
jgi:beta-lactam-binding protein with PASTA domain